VGFPPEGSVLRVYAPRICSRCRRIPGSRGSGVALSPNSCLSASLPGIRIGDLVGDFFSKAQSFLGPNILGTLVTAAFGAFAGAWVASRRETKKLVTTELNAISAARALCFSICNKFLSLKGQYILDLHRDYNIDREAVLARAAAQPNIPGAPMELRLDLQTLTPVWLPTQTLERLVFERISIRGRALVAAVDLVGAIDALAKSIGQRNELISAIQHQTEITQQELMYRYFGLMSPTGAVDERFASNIIALYAQTDDCIFFSRILAQDLFQHAGALHRRFAWRYRLGLPKPVQEDWAIAEARGLMPAREKYASWLQGFRTTPSRWQRLREWLRTIATSCGLTRPRERPDVVW
jgi:hypothetical protein